MASRLQMNLTSIQADLLQEIQEQCHLNKTEVVENALMLLGWAVNEKRDGRTIASVDERRRVFKEISLPALMRVRKAAA